MLGLIDPAPVVGDLGCGTGQFSETVAPFVRRVVAVDGSGDMLEPDAKGPPLFAALASKPR